LDGPLPEREPPPRSFFQRQLPLPAPPPSMERLNRRLRAIADADNVKGVLFLLRGLGIGGGTLQNVRRAIQRLQAAGKEVVVYTPYLDTAHYAVAAAADRIVVPPGAQFSVMGLRTEAVFLKDALARIGVEAEVAQISPYKAGADMFSQSEMTPEHRAQLEWLLDERFDWLTAVIADGRNKTEDEVKTLIDQAPYAAEEARELGLVDDIAYEDELAELLGETETEVEAENVERAADADSAIRDPQSAMARAKLLRWHEAQPLLLERPYQRPSKFIGVISLEGMIMMG
ncbi:MAG: hypothetical protein GY803_12110, partial [Chloroflexi bacterium]|nr:hypothetical protein [Chloroflexota bacterium]